MASIAVTKLPGKKLFQKVDPELLERRRAAVKQLVKAFVTNSTSLAKSVHQISSIFVKPPLAAARAASSNGPVHLSVARIQKRDFLKTKQFRAVVSIDDL